MLGKLATHEFAFGGPSFDLPWPPARNPWNPDHFTSGSSSGTGAAVAAGLILGGTGSDTGGSIRGPAALCGIAGIKPTYGLCSRAGVLPLAFSLDHTGPMAWTVEDCALLLQAMAGHDPQDPASANRPVPDFSADLGQDAKGLRIGVVRNWHETDRPVSPAVQAGIDRAVDIWRAQGAEIRDVTLPSLLDFQAANYIILTAEAFALHEPWMRERFNDYGELLRDRMVYGGLFAATDYVQALRFRRELCAAVAAASADVDLLLTAGAPAEAPRIDADPEMGQDWPNPVSPRRSTSPAGPPCASAPASARTACRSASRSPPSRSRNQPCSAPPTPSSRRPGSARNARRSPAPAGLPRPLSDTIEGGGGRVVWLDAPDGARLRAAHWPGERATLLFLSGRTEFIERNLETVDALRDRGFAVWTLDWRGQGGSGRALRDTMRNHVRSFDDHLADLDRLVAEQIGPAGPLLMLAHSMGGHIGLRYLAMRPGRFARAVLTAPMIDFIRPARLSRRGAWALAHAACLLPSLSGRFGPGTARAPDPHRPFDGNPLTACPERFAADRAWLEQYPELVSGGATWGWLRAATASIAKLHQPTVAARIDCPVLIALAGHERLVDNAATRAFTARLKHATILELPEARHEILRETDATRARFWAEFDRFVAG